MEYLVMQLTPQDKLMGNEPINIRISLEDIDKVPETILAAADRDGVTVFSCGYKAYLIINGWLWHAQQQFAEQSLVNFTFYFDAKLQDNEIHPISTGQSAFEEAASIYACKPNRVGEEANEKT